jgi:hypothetical protein
METAGCSIQRMRLRSSQFVFLMLLICSVQVREEYAWHLRDGAVSSRASSPAQQREAAARSARQLNRLCLELERLSPAMSLSAAAMEAHRTVWTMPRPARESAAIVSHTSFLRA